MPTLLTLEQLCRECNKLNIESPALAELLTRMIDIDSVLYKFDIDENSLFSELNKWQAIKDIML
jgi:hypothetical protein